MEIVKWILQVECSLGVFIFREWLKSHYSIWPKMQYLIRAGINEKPAISSLLIEKLIIMFDFKIICPTWRSGYHKSYNYPDINIRQIYNIQNTRNVYCLLWLDVVLKISFYKCKNTSISTNYYQQVCKKTYWQISGSFFSQFDVSRSLYLCKILEMTNEAQSYANLGIKIQLFNSSDS